MRFLGAIGFIHFAFGLALISSVSQHSAAQTGLVEEKGETVMGKDAAGQIKPENLAKIFLNPSTLKGVRDNLPHILTALSQKGLDDPQMLAIAFTLIRLNAPLFVPVSEPVSVLNTAPNGPPYGLYDHRYGNMGPPDGERYRGRGFLPLEGRDAYKRIGKAIGTDLEYNPELASDPRIASQILAELIKNVESQIRAALARNDISGIRRLFDSAAHGLDEFGPFYQKALGIIQASDYTPPKK